MDTPERAPRMALLFDVERATEAVLSFLRKTKVGQKVTIPPQGGEEQGSSEGARAEAEEGGPGPPI